MNTIDIITDGACSGNPGRGGWATIILHNGNAIEHSGSAEDTTNNRMELTAALVGLQHTPRDHTIHIHTDSQYLINGITKWVKGWQKNGWKTRTGDPVENKDLWEALIAHTHPNVHWHHVKGHAGHVHNERANTLAQLQAGSRGAGAATRPVPRPTPSRPLPAGSAATIGTRFPCYISVVNGVVERHATWDDCKAATHGVSGARFKKVGSLAELQAQLRSWGVSSGS
ncbi:MAG: ribonuclease HI [Chloroflexi bacterium]|nr:MAG: ribonuclease HI [Chloroflexota bacterium]